MEKMMLISKDNIVVKNAKGEIKEAKFKNLSIDTGWLYKHFYSPEARERICKMRHIRRFEERQ